MLLRQSTIYCNYNILRHRGPLGSSQTRLLGGFRGRRGFDKWNDCLLTTYEIRGEGSSCGLLLVPPMPLVLLLFAHNDVKYNAVDKQLNK